MLYTYTNVLFVLGRGVVDAVREMRKAYWVEFYPWIPWR